MIRTGLTDVFYCVLIYRPPGPASVFLNDFTEFLASIIKLEKVLIIGDFNLHIDKVSCNMAADLLSITDSFNFTQHVSGPTHSKGHTLDLVFSLGLNIANVCVEDVCVSDHSCVFFDLTFPLDPPPPKMRVVRRFINEEAVQKFSVLFDPRSLVGYSDADALIGAFNSRCSDIINKVAPAKSCLVSHKKHCPWIDEPIKNLQRNCRKVERLWKTTNLEVHRIQLKELRGVGGIDEYMERKQRQCSLKIQRQGEAALVEPYTTHTTL